MCKIILIFVFQCQPELVLTYVGGRYGDEATHVFNEEEGALSGHTPYVAVCERISGKDIRAQRFDGFIYFFPT